MPFWLWLGWVVDDDLVEDVLVVRSRTFGS